MKDEAATSKDEGTFRLNVVLRPGLAKLQLLLRRGSEERSKPGSTTRRGGEERSEPMIGLLSLIPKLPGYLTKRKDDSINVINHNQNHIFGNSCFTTRFSQWVGIEASFELF